MRIDDIAT